MLSEFSKSNMVVGHEALMEATGYSKPAEVRACLRKQGIRFFVGKHGRIWTTLGAIELAMGATFLQHEVSEGQKIEEDFKW